MASATMDGRCSGVMAGRRRRSGCAVTALWLASLLLASRSAPAWGLITGGEDNAPLSIAGWPPGADKVFNVPGRVAYWEGPPFGGGQHHAECRGTADDLNAVLIDFARIDLPVRKLVILDGPGASFWLNPNREPGKADAARIDWSFMVWTSDGWRLQQGLPIDFTATPRADAPETVLTIYAGVIRYEDLKIPPGLVIDDQRLVAHGFGPEDGHVLEGAITDQTTGAPLPGTLRLERIEPRKTGGYDYTLAAAAVAGPDGRWVLRQSPAGWHQLVATAPGYAPRIVGYSHRNDADPPRWQRLDGRLKLAGEVSGIVVDGDGRPLADAEASIRSVMADPTSHYHAPGELSARTDADGRFTITGVPHGPAAISAHKQGYVPSGPDQPIKSPGRDIRITLVPAATLVVTVDFAGAPRPEDYLIAIEPEAGAAVGRWGGSGSISAQNQIRFEHVPPGRYVFYGRPNPGNDRQRSRQVTVELHGGKTTEITLPATPRPE